MSLDSQLHRPTKANYHSAGNPGEEGFAHWIEIFDAAWNRIALCVDSSAVARKIESAARQCAEAMEAQAELDKALAAQGTTRDHESATGNEERGAA